MPATPTTSTTKKILLIIMIMLVFKDDYRRHRISAARSGEFLNREV